MTQILGNACREHAIDSHSIAWSVKVVKMSKNLAVGLLLVQLYSTSNEQKMKLWICASRAHRTLQDSSVFRRIVQPSLSCGPSKDACENLHQKMSEKWPLSFKFLSLTVWWQQQCTSQKVTRDPHCGGGEVWSLPWPFTNLFWLEKILRSLSPNVM